MFKLLSGMTFFDLHLEHRTVCQPGITYLLEEWQYAQKDLKIISKSSSVVIVMNFVLLFTLFATLHKTPKLHLISCGRHFVKTQSFFRVCSETVSFHKFPHLKITVKGFQLKTTWFVIEEAYF